MLTLACLDIDRLDFGGEGPAVHGGLRTLE